MPREIKELTNCHNRKHFNYKACRRPGYRDPDTDTYIIDVKASREVFYNCVLDINSIMVTLVNNFLCHKIEFLVIDKIINDCYNMGTIFRELKTFEERYSFAMAQIDHKTQDLDKEITEDIVTNRFKLREIGRKCFPMESYQKEITIEEGKVLDPEMNFHVGGGVSYDQVKLNLFLKQEYEALSAEEVDLFKSKLTIKPRVSWADDVRENEGDSKDYRLEHKQRKMKEKSSIAIS